MASRSTWGSGNAVLLAAEDLRRKLCKKEGAKVFSVPADQVTAYAGGCAAATAPSAGRFATGLYNPDGTAVTRGRGRDRQLCAAGRAEP